MIVPGIKIETPEGFRPVLVVNRAKRKVYGCKFITFDNLMIESDKRQHFFLRDGSIIRAGKIKIDTWLKTKRGSVRIKTVIRTIDCYGQYTMIQPSSFGGKYYLDNGVLTAYRI